MINLENGYATEIENQKENLISQNTPEFNSAILGFLLNSLISPEKYEKEIKKRIFFEKLQSVDFALTVCFIPVFLLATGSLFSLRVEGVDFIIFCIAAGITAVIFATIALIFFSHMYMMFDFRRKIAKKMVKKITDLYGVNFSKDALNTPEGLGKVFSVLNLLNNNTSINGKSQNIINDFVEEIEENGVSSKLCKKALIDASENFVQVGGKEIQSEYKKNRASHLAVLWR